MEDDDKLTPELKLPDSRLDTFRRSLNQLNDFSSSIAFLNIQWNHLEDHLKELHTVRDSAQAKLEGLEKREAQLNVLRESVEERIREVEAREAEFELLQDKEIQELKTQFEFLQDERDSVERKSILLTEKEQRFEKARKEIENKEKQCAEFSNQLKLKDDQCSRLVSELEAKGMEVEERRKELELRAEKFRDLELKEKLIGESCEKLQVEKKKFMKRCEQVELKENLIEERCEKLELEKDRFMERCREFELKEKLIEERCERLELEKQKLMKRCDEVELKQKLIEERCDGMEVEEKKFIKRRETIELKEKLVGERCEKLEVEEQKFMRRCEEVELKEGLIVERCEELEVEKKKLMVRCEEVELKEGLIEERCEELEVEKKKLMERREEVELKENLIEERCKGLKLEEKKFMKRCDTVELKEKSIGERCEKLELEKKKFMKRCETVELKEKLIEERCGKLELEKKKFMRRCEEVELKEKLIDERCEELEVEKKKFTRRCEEVELKEKLSVERCEELEVEKKKLMERREEVELDEKLIEGRCEELELEKNKITVRSVEIDLKEKLLEERCEELELEKRKLMEQCLEVSIDERSVQLELEKSNCMEQHEGVELKKKRIQRWREFESKEKKLFDDPQKPFPVNHAKDYPGDANLHFTVTMDAKALQIFLNEHCEEYDSMRNDVLTALSFSSDPAKLVLDAMQGFYPPHLKKGDKEFEKDVIRKSCILLLEQLLKVSVVISPPVKQEAMKLAFVWITKMKADAEHSLEVLGFLQLLASYGLASAFDVDELFTYFEIVAQHSQALELFHGLGLVDKVSGFIQNLTRKKLRVEAIRFIHAFKLVNEFPTAPLLIGFLRDSKSAAKRYRKRNASPQGQVEAANQRIADLKQAIRCIEEYKIEYKPSVKNLKQLVDQLEKEYSKRDANLKRKAKASGHKIKRQCFKRKRLASTVDHRDYPLLAPVTASATGQCPTDFPKTTSTVVSDTCNQLQQLSGNKRPRIGDLVEKSLDSCHGDAEQGNLPLKRKDASAAFDLQPERNCLSFNTNKEALRHALNTSENYQFAEECLQSRCDLPVISKDASAALDLQPEHNCLSFNTNKEALRHTLNTSENSPSALKECLESTCDPGKFCLLMEQLSSDSFKITPQLKEHAIGVARHWQSLLEAKRDDPLEVICFLRFVAAYKLAYIFSADKLLGLLDTDYWCKKAPDLCQVLGLTDKIPMFVENLIRRGQNLEAVKYIYALNIVDVFNPVFILKNHLINSSTMQDGDIDKEINALKDVIKCISDFKIIGLSPESLKRQIVVLEKQKQEKLEEQKEEKPLVVQTSDVKTNFVSSRSRLEQQVSTASAPITSESAFNSQLLQQQSENNGPRVHSSMDPQKVSIGATSTVHSTEHPLQHSPNLIMNNDVPRMNAPPNCSTRQPLPQNLPGAFTSQDNVPSTNLPSRHDSSVQNPLQYLQGYRPNSSMQLPQQHLSGLHTSQCNPGMNAPPRYVAPIQPHLQHPPSLCTSQGNPGMNPPPSLYSSMQPPLQHRPSLFTSNPPTYDSSAQSSLPNKPYASQGHPYMNAPPNPYSSRQPVPHYQQGSYMSQPNTPWNHNFPENPPKMQLQWNGFAYVPVVNERPGL
ncbi:Frigida-like protein [Euphorbia peplus]|nr:Frigida-like protein [Euphorbia peplus]